ncbi:tyrosine-type recombinase/integrase [archaeon]|jgi:integrase/recombinase XerD|nr:tyrosine-type recombinase/integrase [archaeon]MBT3730808.1 tyrosine-type recombinase/integrase [archaeon]MBT4670122.1 tyrosine-type recombinase/integrase [archaeon]MBT7052609.1 tyrosine-type recombinase/integrase [archaeon]MBT7402932.1 tyrosine-type recombinase/integrase [Candidatus Woesearchaeota archaeon]
MGYDGTRIYYKSKKNQLVRAFEKVDESDITANNKKLIKEFSTNLLSRGRSEQRVSKLIHQVKVLAEVAENDLDQLNKRDIERILCYIEQQNKHSATTKADYKRALKQFYKWLEEDDDRLFKAEELERIRLTRFYQYIKKIEKKEQIIQIDPTTILTEKDIDKVVEATPNYKEKAMIKFLHESGARVGELLNMKVKDIDFKGMNANIILDGKTGKRKITCVTSVPYLVRYLEIHPFKDNPNSYFWLGENTRMMHKPIRYIGAKKIIAKCFKKANVSKRHNPHWFRHSRASLLAPEFPEVMLCSYMGWTLGSKQVRRYVHLSNKQLEQAYMKMYGLQDEKEVRNLPLKCGCGVINEKSSRYCHQCSRPLNVHVALQDEEKKSIEMDKSIKFLMEIMQDPELYKKFQEFKDQI